LLNHTQCCGEWLGKNSVKKFVDHDPVLDDFRNLMLTFLSADISGKIFLNIRLIVVVWSC